MGLRVTVVAAVVAMGFSAVPGMAQTKVPPNFSFPAGKDSPGPVTFSHEQHKQFAEKCTACHTKIFKMKAGEQCGACHNGKTEMGGKVAFAVDDQANCTRCHKK